VTTLAVPLGSVPVTLRRYGAVTRDSGGYATALPTPTETTIYAAVQPMKGRDLQILPEGERAKDYRKFYTYSEVRTSVQATGEPADRIVYGGIVYEVQQVKQEIDVIPNFKGYMVAVQEGGE